MRSLLVEDDNFKFERILSVLPTRLKPNVLRADSVHAAIAAIHEHNHFHCILLDMALPSHGPKAGAGSPTSMLSGGAEVLMELAYLTRDDPVVVITQYPEIEIEGVLVVTSNALGHIRNLIKAHIVGVIQYRHEQPEWAGELNVLLEGIKCAS